MKVTMPAIALMTVEDVGTTHPLSALSFHDIRGALHSAVLVLSLQLGFSWLPSFGLKLLH